MIRPRRKRRGEVETRAVEQSGAVAVLVSVRSVPLTRVRLMQLVERAARLAASTRRARLDALSIALVGDTTMRRLNRDFHATDATTDVLAFPFREGKRIDAEIVVCVPYARREARRRGLSWCAELVLYVVHGVLHLTGEDDATAHGARRMRRFERGILARLRLPLPASHLNELKHDDTGAT